jgi:DNA invertase Pin-like site-specific DNA recombinase
MYQYYNQPIKERNVAIYARVSTEHEAQLSALENQRDWYTPFLAQHPEWHIIRMYVDEGITGTSANKRPQFLQMIQDAENGEFDLILTREVSRFARNTVDTLQYTRQLKAKGVEVFFINDNIKTFDGDGELRLTIMATLAQDESRKTSIRVKAGQQTSMDKGVYYGNGNILGYDRVGKTMVINPEQAKTVRMIFDMYLDGMGMRAIQFKLEQAGRLTAMGKSNWHMSNISKILQNSFYCGIITYHKEYTPDFLEQKKIKNFGDIELTKVKGEHEPIVTEEEYYRVQEMLSKRRKEIGNSSYGKRVVKGTREAPNVWSRLMECECGHKFCRRVWHKDNPNEIMRYSYQCYHQSRTGTIRTRMNKGLSTEGICRSPMIPEWKLQLMATYIFKKYITNTSFILDFAESLLEKHKNDKEEVVDNSDVIEQKRQKMIKLSQRLDNLIEMRADNEISRDTFKEKSKQVNAQIEELQNEINKLMPPSASIEEPDRDYENKISVLRFYMDQVADFDKLEIIPDSIIEAFVEKIIVSEHKCSWYLRFGLDPDSPAELEVTGKRDKAEIKEIGSSITPSHVNSNTGCNQRVKELDKALISEVLESDFVKVFEFVINIEQAKEYLYSFSTAHRVRPCVWDDLNIEVYL